MAIKSPAAPGGIRFAIRNGLDFVHCFVTAEALQDYATRMNLAEGAEPLEIFNVSEFEVRRCADEKLRRNEVKRDGGILITSEDLNGRSTDLRPAGDQEPAS